MKHRLMTVFYFLGTAVLVALRTVQIILFTEEKSAFLSQKAMPFNIIFAVLLAGAVASAFVIAFIKPHEMCEVPEKSFPSLIVCSTVGGLYLVSGLLSYILHNSGIFFALVSVLAAAAILLYGYTEFKGYEFPGVLSLIFVATAAWQFILSYSFYTTRPLRVSTVIEVFAMVALLLFFLLFGKLKSKVNKRKSVKLLFPLGLATSALCFVAVLPELLAIALKSSDKLAATSVSPVSLLAGGIFAAFTSYYCFKALDDEPIEPIDETAEELEHFKVVNLAVDDED